MLDSRQNGRRFKPHRRHFVVSLSKYINPSLVLVQPRKTRPYITERLLMGRVKNQINHQSINQSKIISQKCSSWCHLPKCTNCSAPANKWAARALNKEYTLMTFPPGPLVQIQNNFTELFLMMASTKHKQFR